VYFAKYGTTGSKEYQRHVPREWITSYFICQDCGRDHDQDRDECPDCGRLRVRHTVAEQPFMQARSRVVP
jgi:rRNA maturation endonuclease Nob1